MILVPASAVSNPPCTTCASLVPPWLLARRHPPGRSVDLRHSNEVLTDDGKQSTNRFAKVKGEVLFERCCRQNGIHYVLTARARRPRQTISTPIGWLTPAEHFRFGTRTEIPGDDPVVPQRVSVTEVKRRV